MGSQLAVVGIRISSIFFLGFSGMNIHATAFNHCGSIIMPLTSCLINNCVHTNKTKGYFKVIFNYKNCFNMTNGTSHWLEANDGANIPVRSFNSYRSSVGIPYRNTSRDHRHTPRYPRFTLPTCKTMYVVFPGSFHVPQSNLVNDSKPLFWNLGHDPAPISKT